MSQNVYIDTDQETMFIAEQGWMHPDGTWSAYVGCNRIYHTYKKAKQYNPHSKIWEVSMDWRLVDGGVNG